MPESRRGGARPGAGRKPGGKNPSTLTKEAAREALRQIVLQHMSELVGSQIAAAKGIKYLVARNRVSGKFVRVTERAMKAILAGKGDAELEAIEVWQKDPSTQAFTDLMNRAVDKPKEQEQEIKLTGELTVVSERLAAARKRLAQQS